MLSSVHVTPIDHIFILVMFNTQGASKLIKQFVGSGSEGAHKYAWGGCSIWAAFLHFFAYTHPLTVMPRLFSHHVDA